MARLDAKFLVNLDPSQCSNNGTVHLICKLGEWRLQRPSRPRGGGVTERSVLPDDKNLPSVPPLQLRIPADYPEQSPYWADHADQYGESGSADGPQLLCQV